MSDHKDLTNHATLPTLRLPAGSARALSAAECLVNAEHCAADKWRSEGDERAWRALVERRRADGSIEEMERTGERPAATC